MEKKSRGVELDGNSLTIEQLVAISRRGEKVSISTEAKARVRASRKALEEALDAGRPIYGVNTGFGELQDRLVGRNQTSMLQLNLVRSTSAGTGAPLPAEETRAMMVLRLNTLVKGYSGIRLDVVNLLAEMINRRVHPVIPTKGSVGASGDLAPLAHMALVLTGEGRAEYKGREMSGGRALSEAGLSPVKLKEKEGLALINGTQFMNAIGSLALSDAEMLFRQALMIFSMSLEALGGKITPFDRRVVSLRAHRGSLRVASAIREICRGSSNVARSTSVQDPYTLRCAPQVLGPLADMIGYCRNVLTEEMNSTTDNPIVFPEDGEVVSAGNFHGQPVAVALDALCIPLQAMAAFSERRTARLTDSKLSGLNAFLSRKPGLESGYMIAQYTAAALVSEGKVLCHPASADSIPTSANQEDFVSMGAHAAMKLRQMLDNSFTVLAIEAVCAAQALDLAGGPSADAVKKAHSAVRKVVPPLDSDRVVAADIENCARLLRGGGIDPGNV